MNFEVLVVVVYCQNALKNSQKKKTFVAITLTHHPTEKLDDKILRNDISQYFDDRI
jgi:hypothetical protein